MEEDYRLCNAFDYMDVTGQKRSMLTCFCDCAAVDEWASHPTKKNFSNALRMVEDRIRVPYPGGAHRLEVSTIGFTVIAFFVLSIHWAAVLICAGFAVGAHYAKFHLLDSILAGAVVAELMHFVMENLWEDLPALALVQFCLCWMCPGPDGPELPWRTTKDMQGVWFGCLVVVFGASYSAMTSSFHRAHAASIILIGVARLALLLRKDAVILPV